jgi:chromosome segregation ATPase
MDPITDLIVVGIVPTVISIVSLAKGLVIEAETKTHSPRMLAVEKDVASALSQIGTLAQQLQSHGQMMNSAMSIISALSPDLKSLLEQHKAQVQAIEQKSVSLDQKIQELQTLIQTLQGGGGGNDDVDDTQDTTQDAHKVQTETPSQKPLVANQAQSAITRDEVSAKKSPV